MVLRHFNLREQPFGVTPDPRFLYASGTHREALASLLYGVQSGLGFMTLTAKPGMGKTTLLFEALRRLGAGTRTVFLFQTVTSPTELVHALLIDLGVREIPASLVEMQALLNEILVAQCSTGQRLVVAIDEAQNLGDSVLEAVRMLSNFETSREKLMQIILCGQPQLAEKLASPQLLQLRQRISIFAHLKPFTAVETSAYIQHRLLISGYESATPLFTDAALALIAKHSDGIPRNINNLCFNALTIGCALRRPHIDADVIQEVVNDLDVDRLDDKVTEIPELLISQPEFVVRESTLATHAPEPVAVVVKQSNPPALVPPTTPADMSAPVEESTGSDYGYEDEYEEQDTGSKKIMLWSVAACIIVAIFVWLGIKDYRALKADGTIRDTEAQPPPVIRRPVLPAASEPKLQPRTQPRTQPASPRAGSVADPQTRVVKVQAGQSLIEICTEHFGKCRPELLQQIVKLNPTVADPNHIESGQRIVIPILLATSAGNE